MSTSTIVLIDIVAFALLAIIGYFTYYQFFKRKEIKIAHEKPAETTEKYSINDYENIVGTLKPKKKETPSIIVLKEEKKENHGHNEHHNTEHEEKPSHIKLDEAIIGGIIIEKKH